MPLESPPVVPAPFYDLSFAPGDAIDLTYQVSVLGGVTDPIVNTVKEL